MLANYLVTRASVDDQVREMAAALRRDLRMAMDHDAVAESGRANAAVRLLWEHVDTSDEHTLHQTLAPATPGQIAVFAISFSDADVCNGGFHQYFANHTGILAPEALDGFHRVGMPDRAQLFARAMQRFPGGMAPRSWQRRNDLLQAIPYDEWDAFAVPIEDEYYALANEAPLDRALARYVAAHPDDFFVDP